MIALAMVSAFLLLLPIDPHSGQSPPPTGFVSASPQAPIVYRSDEMRDSPPRAKYKTEPRYTEEARRNHIEGDVILQATIGADGKPQNPVVVRGLGYGLDQQAVEAVRSWDFDPAKKDGVPHAVSASIQVAFRLHSDDVWNAEGSGQQSYLSPDGAFSLSYPSSFKIHADPSGKADRSMCHGSILCLDYDRSLYRGSDAGNAEFWVRILEQQTPGQVGAKPIATSAECFSAHFFYSPPLTATAGTTAINGVDFRVTEWLGGTARHATVAHLWIYRTFYHEKCYELGSQISVSRANGGSQEGDKSGNGTSVRDALEGIVKTFHFGNEILLFSVQKKQQIPRAKNQFSESTRRFGGARDDSACGWRARYRAAGTRFLKTAYQHSAFAASC